MVPQVTATVKEAKPETLNPTITTAPKKASVKSKKASGIGAKPLTTPKPVANHPPTSPLEEISDLLDPSLSRHACS